MYYNNKTNSNNKKHSSRNAFNRQVYTNEYSRSSYNTYPSNVQNPPQMQQPRKHFMPQQQFMPGQQCMPQQFIPYSRRSEQNANRRTFDSNCETYGQSYNVPSYINQANPSKKVKEFETQNAPRSNKNSEKVKDEYKLYICPSCTNQYDCVCKFKSIILILQFTILKNI